MARRPGSLMSFRCRHLCVWFLAVAAGACTPFKTDPAGDGGARDADPPDSTTMGDAPDGGALDSTTLGDDASSEAGSQCGHRAPPAKPAVVDAGGSLDLVLAVSESSSWGTDDAGNQSYRVVGFDLDDTCTGERQGASCVEPPWAKHDHTDGVDGIDNAWGQISLDSVRVDAVTPTMLFRVSSYSGQPDDDQVDVALYAGLGVAPRDGGDGGGAPLWDGNDRWQIMREMLAPSTSPSLDQPLYHDDAAYVSSGTLVAHFRAALWSPGVASTPYRLTPASQVVLAGSLTQTGGLWVLKDAVVDMRVGITDVLAGAAQLPEDGGVVCQDPAAFQLYVQELCPYVDIATVLGPASAACDALSAAGLFQASQALLGDVLLPALPPATCAPEINLATDPCDSLGD